MKKAKEELTKPTKEIKEEPIETTERKTKSSIFKKNLTEEKLSVHLCDFPVFNQQYIDLADTDRTEIVKTIVSLGHKIRSQHNLKVRQPLNEVRIYSEKLDEYAGLKNIDGENKAVARHVLCKTMFAKNQFKILVKETFGVLLEEQDFLQGSWEYDLPPNEEEEFFNTWKPLGE